MNKENNFSSNSDKVINFPKKKNKKPRAYIIYIILLILIIIISANVGNGSKYTSTSESKGELISLSNANNYDFCSYKDGFALAKDGLISYYKADNTLQWEIKASKTAPKLAICGDYLLSYYNDDKLAVVSNGSKTIRIETPGNVQSGYVNSNGYCVLLQDEFGLKNKIVVYNKKGEVIYYRNNPDKFITHITLSDDNKRLVTCELVTDDSSISSNLVVTNIKKNEVIANIPLEGTIPGSCILTGKNEIVAVTETSLCCYSLGGKLNWQKDFDGKRIHRYSYDDGLFALVFNTDDSANSGSEVEFYNKNGRRTGGYKTEEKIENIHLKGKTTLITMNRRLVLTNQKGKQLSSLDITYDMKKTIFMDTKKTVLIISNSQDARLIELK